MNSNNQSDKARTQNLEKDVNESANENRNVSDAKGTGNKMQNSAAGNSGNYNQGKGTGMSSEAGAGQREKSWQDTGGSQAHQQKKDDSNNTNRDMHGNNQKVSEGNKQAGAQQHTDNKHPENMQHKKSDSSEQRK